MSEEKKKEKELQLREQIKSSEAKIIEAQNKRNRRIANFFIRLLMLISTLSVWWAPYSIYKITGKFWLLGLYVLAIPAGLMLVSAIRRIVHGNNQ